METHSPTTQSVALGERSIPKFFHPLLAWPSCTGSVPRYVGTGPMNVATTTNGGSSWSGPYARSWYYAESQGSGVAIGNTVYFVAPNGPVGSTDIYYVTYTYGSGSWNSAVEIDSGSSASITSDGASNLYIFYTGGSSVKYVMSTSGGSSWIAPKTLVSSETSPNCMNLAYSTTSGYVVAAWVTARATSS